MFGIRFFFKFAALHTLVCLLNTEQTGANPLSEHLNDEILARQLKEDIKNVFFQHQVYFCKNNAGFYIWDLLSKSQYFIIMVHKSVWGKIYTIHAYLYISVRHYNAGMSSRS